MEALASPISLLIKTAPGNDAQGGAPGNSGWAGEIPQDLFAALLSRQLGAAMPGDSQLPQALPQEMLSEPGADADPAELVADQLLLPEQTAVPLAAPIMLPPVAAAAVAQAPARSEGIAVVGSAISAAAGQGQTAGDVVDLAGLGEVAVEPAPRQVVAAEPASFAAATGAAQADGRSALSMRSADLALELPPVAPAIEELPPPSATTTFALPATPARTEAPAQAGSIAQPVTSDIWGEKLGERVVWMVSQQHQNVELHLNPPALGPLEVRLSMNDNQASLTFSTQHAPVREAIEGATSRLREMLAESGVSLGSVSVNVGNFNQPQPGNQAQADNRGQVQSWSGSVPAEPALPATLVTSLRHKGMVDIFA